MLDLSETAISLALNNKPGVSTETRRMVIEQATRYGYDFSRIRGKRRDLGKVAIIRGPYHLVAEQGNTIFDDITEGVRQVLSKQSAANEVINLSSKDLSDSELERLVMDLRQDDVGGIIVVGSDVPKKAVAEFVGVGAPIVLVEAFFHDLPCSAVTVSNRLGGRLAAVYLCDTYMSEPMYLRCRYRTEGFDERILGFMEAVRYKSFSRHKVSVQTLSPSCEGAHDDMRRLLDDGLPLPRAIFAETDQLALGAAQALLEHGLRIPDDVAIMGFDDMAAAKDFEVPLTTIGYPKAFMGIEAAKRLVDLMRDPTPYTVRTEVTTTLVKRASA